jgi:hypothetical protein
MKYTTINLMLPTFKRVDRLRQFIDSAMGLADDKACLRFTFVVNVSDADTRTYLAEQNTIPKAQYHIIDEDTDQPNLPAYFNAAYDHTAFACDTEVVTMVGDDMVFLTRGWDAAVLAEINAADGAVILHVNDAFIAQERLCVNLFTTRRIVDATGRGEFMCPRFHTEMIDVIWHLIGRCTGLIKYRGDIVLQHNHGSNVNGGARDATFFRMAPLRQMANTDHANNKWWTHAYATYSAARIIDAGMGKWNEVAT